MVIARLSSASHEAVTGPYQAFTDVPWLFGLLLATALLVELRTIFHLREPSQGLVGYLSYHEVYFGCLDFVPIALTVAGLLAIEAAFKRPWGAVAAVSSSSSATLVHHKAAALLLSNCTF